MDQPHLARINRASTLARTGKVRTVLYGRERNRQKWGDKRCVHFVWNLKELQCNPDSLDERTETTSEEGDILTNQVLLDSLQGRTSTFKVVILHWGWLWSVFVRLRASA